MTIDYVALAADICTAAPSNYNCDTDADCADGLKCLGSGPASLCYSGCDSDADCSTGGTLDYECVTDAFGFSACRPAGLDISCTDDSVSIFDNLNGFTCMAALSHPERRQRLFGGLHGGGGHERDPRGAVKQQRRHVRRASTQLKSRLLRLPQPHAHEQSR